MAAGDLSDALRDRVRQRVGQSSQSGLLDEDIFAFLNRAQYDLGWRLHDAAMPELTEVASGSLTASRVALPTDFWREVTVDIGTGSSRQTCVRWPVTQLDALDNNTLLTPSTSSPYYFIWYQATDGALRLIIDLGNAASTSAYQLRYVKLPTTMTTDVDPLYKSDKYGMIVDFACMMYHQMKGNDAQRARLWQQYIAQIITVNTRYMPGTLHEGKPGDIG